MRTPVNVQNQNRVGECPLETLTSGVLSSTRDGLQVGIIATNAIHLGSSITYLWSLSSNEKSFEFKNWYILHTEIFRKIFFSFLFIKWNWLPIVIFSYTFFSCFSFHTQFLSHAKHPKQINNIGSCKRQVNRNHFSVFLFTFLNLFHSLYFLSIHFSIQFFPHSLIVFFHFNLKSFLFFRK